MPIDPELKEQVYTDVNYRLKGGGSADGAGEIFCGRVRVRLRCVHGNQQFFWSSESCECTVPGNLLDMNHIKADDRI